MSDTLNIVIPSSAAGSFAITYSVAGVAPNLSTGYTAQMKVWRSGLALTAAADTTMSNGSGITLGTAGSITLNLALLAGQMLSADATEAAWYYTLQVTPTGGNAQRVCSGSLVRAQP